MGNGESRCAACADPDDLDFQRVLFTANPYLGNVVGTYTDWTPLDERGQLVPGTP